MTNENIVEVVRYIRPGKPYPARKHSVRNKDNLYGITILFLIDYEDGTVEARFSVCSGDNFDRQLGKGFARGKSSITFPLPGKNTSLTDALIAHISGCEDVDGYFYEEVEQMFLESLRKLHLKKVPKKGDRVVIVTNQPHYEAWSNLENIKGQKGVVVDVRGRYVDVWLDGVNFLQGCSVSDLEVVA